jgi:hypothetical protein
MLANVTSKRSNARGTVKWALPARVILCEIMVTMCFGAKGTAQRVGLRLSWASANACPETPGVSLYRFSAGLAFAAPPRDRASVQRD